MEYDDWKKTKPLTRKTLTKIFIVEKYNQFASKHILFIEGGAKREKGRYSFTSKVGLTWTITVSFGLQVSLREHQSGIWKLPSPMSIVALENELARFFSKLRTMDVVDIFTGVSPSTKLFWKIFLSFEYTVPAVFCTPAVYTTKSK